MIFLEQILVVITSPSIFLMPVRTNHFILLALLDQLIIIILLTQYASPSTATTKMAPAWTTSPIGDCSSSGSGMKTPSPTLPLLGRECLLLPPAGGGWEGGLLSPEMTSSTTSTPFSTTPPTG